MKSQKAREFFDGMVSLPKAMGKAWLLPLGGAALGAVSVGAAALLGSAITFGAVVVASTIIFGSLGFGAVLMGATDLKVQNDKMIEQGLPEMSSAKVRGMAVSSMLLIGAFMAASLSSVGINAENRNEIQKRSVFNNASTRTVADDAPIQKSKSIITPGR